jgi:hypothetical protein
MYVCVEYSAVATVMQYWTKRLGVAWTLWWHGWTSPERWYLRICD